MEPNLNPDEAAAVYWDAADESWAVGDDVPRLVSVYADEDRWYWRRPWRWAQRIPLLGRRIPSKEIKLTPDDGLAMTNGAFTLVWSTSGIMRAEWGASSVIEGTAVVPDDEICE